MFYFILVLVAFSALGVIYDVLFDKDDIPKSMMLDEEEKKKSLTIKYFISRAIILMALVVLYKALKIIGLTFF